MPANAPETAGTIVPTLRYRDVPAAIDWLCEAFGFRTHVVERNAQGAIRYAQLVFGHGMVVLGPVEDSAVDGLMVQPGEMGGLETQVCYGYAEDARALCARAREAGATLLLDEEERAGTSSIYSFRDPEGHIWNFGTYDPWRRQPPLRQLASPRGSVLRAGAESAALLAGLIALAIASTTMFGWAYHAAEEFASLTFVGAPPAGEVRAPRVEPAPEAGGHEVADGRGAAEMLAREREGRAAAERVAKDARTALAAAERTAAEVRRELQAEQGTRQAAEQAIGPVRDELARERTAREAAELATKRALERKPKAWRLKKVETPWTW
jgi:uncharacterized glyoxalase superfamily protein PhnB